jgi:hypothetical protein
MHAYIHTCTELWVAIMAHKESQMNMHIYKIYNTQTHGSWVCNAGSENLKAAYTYIICIHTKYTQGWVVGMVCGYKAPETKEGGIGTSAVHEVRYDNRAGRFLENLSDLKWEFDYHEGIAGLPLARWEEAQQAEKHGGPWLVGRCDYVCMNACACTFVCMFMYVCIHTYAHTHTGEFEFTTMRQSNGQKGKSLRTNMHACIHTCAHAHTHTGEFEFTTMRKRNGRRGKSPRTTRMRHVWMNVGK